MRMICAPDFKPSVAKLLPIDSGRVATSTRQPRCPDANTAIDRDLTGKAFDETRRMAQRHMESDRMSPRQTRRCTGRVCNQHGKAQDATADIRISPLQFTSTTYKFL